ncbi:hypothetical protein EV663_10985 [Rhodovulum bhavnagarense]|uniref:Tellurium resistance protein n=2 Tax=Rhodovulum bhavnagarense TaxID=992286 RepID=A0A4R2REB1_9RHOB|nr:hypothetical protein EV663_10985 [Rhodovulum bhavnagarense]
MTYGLLAWFVSDALVPAFPENADLGYFAVVNSIIGIMAGWLVMGRLVGHGYGVAVTSGIRTVVVLTVYALLVHSLWEMLQRALGMRYSGVMEALTGLVSLFGEFTFVLVTYPPAVAILLIGGIAAAWISEFVSRRWS